MLENIRQMSWVQSRKWNKAVLNFKDFKIKISNLSIKM